MPATVFSRFSRPAALTLLAIVAAAVAWLVLSSFSVHAPAGASSTQNGDLALYQRIVERLHQGQDFYAAMHRELLDGGYPTASVFNWRTPLLLSVLALAPSPLVGQIGLGVVAAIAVGLCLTMLARRAGPLALGLAVPLIIAGYGMALVPGAATFGEVVAGFLILISASCYGLGRGTIGMAVALLALFVRELAAPYVLICCAFALLEGRRSEIRLAVLGLIGFAVYYALHVHGVLVQLGPNEPADPRSWLAFGGPGFAVQTAAFNGLWLLAPLWVSAVLLPLGILGLFASPAGWRMGVTALVYPLLFLAIGKPFDDYWGALYTPLLAPGLALALPALRDLTRAARPAVAAPLSSHAADGL